MQDLIIIKQLPQIEEHLKELSIEDPKVKNLHGYFTKISEYKKYLYIYENLLYFYQSVQLYIHFLYPYRKNSLFWYFGHFYIALIIIKPPAFLGGWFCFAVKSPPAVGRGHSYKKFYLSGAGGGGGGISSCFLRRESFLRCFSASFIRCLCSCSKRPMLK